MKEVLFYMLPLLEFDEGKPLHLSHVLTSFLPIDDAIANFYSNHLDDYRETYAAGHYGEPGCEWVFSHHEVYVPQDPQMPTMVILRYRPQNTADTDPH
ncbi:MAG: hypothetical protein KA716_16345 [Gloeotrichia echinulata DEX184]|jgi:hypothetical protein|nr:hypothetical protein [Gloeotrichia echinulata DEX184]